MLNFYLIPSLTSALLRTCWFQLKFLFTGHEVCAIVWSKDRRVAPTGVNPFNPRHASTGVHTRNHLEVNGSSREARNPDLLHSFWDLSGILIFFNRSFDRCKKWSKVINARVRERRFLEGELSRGKSDIIVVRVSALRLRHVTHRETIFQVPSQFDYTNLLHRNP